MDADDGHFGVFKLVYFTVLLQNFYSIFTAIFIIVMSFTVHFNCFVSRRFVVSY